MPVWSRRCGSRSLRGVRNSVSRLGALVRRRSFAPLCAVAVFFAGCATNPATGEKQFSLISEGQEIQMGLEADPSIVAGMGLDPDSGRQRYVRELGMKLARVSERPNLPWTFRVIDDPVVNAF